MRLLTLAISLFLLTGVVALGASLPESHVEGTYVEARTADVFTGACFGNAESGIVGELAVFGWKVSKGSYEGVRLDGLGVVGVLRANSTLGDIYSPTYPVKAVLIVDEKANAEQRLALQAFAKKMGGDLLQDIVKVEYRPVKLEVEGGGMHSTSATLSAGELAEIRTRAINASDHICSNEEMWYLPLTKVKHAMPAYTLAHSYQGDGLNTRWSTPDQRSAYVGHFEYQD